MTWLVRDQEVLEPHLALRVIGVFLVFCIVASGTYLANDAIDAGADP